MKFPHDAFLILVAALIGVIVASVFAFFDPAKDNSGVTLMIKVPLAEAQKQSGHGENGAVIMHTLPGCKTQEVLAYPNGGFGLGECITPRSRSQ